MPIVAFPEAYVLLLEGKDVLTFLESLTTNHVSDLQSGESIQTVFTKSNAQIIDVVSLHNLSGTIVMIGYGENLAGVLGHITPRILGHDVSIRDVTELNQVHIAFGEYEIPKSSTSVDCLTHQLLVTSIKNQILSTGESWNEYRIDKVIPWYGAEISNTIHPLACGLGKIVNESKGCYVGQEVFARMRSRGRQGKELVRLPNSETIASNVTTIGKSHSLVIRRIQ